MTRRTRAALLENHITNTHEAVLRSLAHERNGSVPPEGSTDAGLNETGGAFERSPRNGINRRFAMVAQGSRSDRNV